jgi:hypothetical protein
MISADDLRQEIAASRLAIKGDVTTLRAELDFVAKTKRAVVERPLPWLGGAALLGYILSGRRRKKAARHAKGEPEAAKRLTLVGVLLGATRLLFPLARPLLTELATRKLTEFAAKRRP